jgi:hypothetical protein
VSQAKRNASLAKTNTSPAKLSKLTALSKMTAAVMLKSPVSGRLVTLKSPVTGRLKSPPE